MLNKDKLISEIRKLNDSSYSDFKGFPNTCSLACTNWSQAFYEYYKEMTPKSVTFESAKSLQNIKLLGICSSNSLESSSNIFRNSIIQACIEISIGIESGTSGVFRGVPPIGSLNIYKFFKNSLEGGTAEDFAIGLSNEVHNYIITGTAININTGSIIKWN